MILKSRSRFFEDRITRKNVVCITYVVEIVRLEIYIITCLISMLFHCEKIWYEIVILYRPEFINDHLLKEHLLHRLYCIVLEDPDHTKDVDYYIKETFYGIKKCSEYKFCELFDNVQCSSVSLFSFFSFLMSSTTTSLI